MISMLVCRAHVNELPQRDLPSALQEMRIESQTHTSCSPSEMFDELEISKLFNTAVNFQRLPGINFHNTDFEIRIVNTDDPWNVSLRVFQRLARCVSY